jgi:uncharacterized membrane protein YedE/YeeE
MNAYAIVAPTIGGILIGLSASLLFATQGRVAGISGIISGLFTPRSPEFNSKLSFVLSLFVVGTILSVLLQVPGAALSTASIPRLVAAGLLVGFGARLGNGCTSGHGVCGISRLNPRSIVATTLFILLGASAVVIMRYVTGGAS